MQSSNPIEVRFYGNSGPHVVLLHGGPGARGDMAPVARYLSSQFQILEPLQRISSDVPLTVSRHVADLYDVLREPMKKGAIRLVGHSWGAMLALTYAARHPTKVDRVILIGCGTFNQRSREAYRTNMAQRIDSDSQRRVSDLETQLTMEKGRHRRNELFTQLGAIYTRTQAFNPITTKSERLEYDDGGFNETWKDAIFIQDRGIQPAEFAHIQAHVTMIHGDEDPHPGPLIYESLEPFIRDIQYQAIPRCGHTPWIEQEARDEFYRLLTECLR